MKKIFVLFVFCFFCSLVYGEGYEKILTLDSCVQTAVNINHDILIHAQNVDLANQKMKESRSLYFPKIDLNLNVSRFNNTEAMILPGQLLQSPVYLPPENKDIYYSTRLTLWQNLYAGGRIKTTNKLAEINMDKVKNEANAVKNNVINRVKTAFNTCLLYKEKYKLASKELEKIQNKNSVAAKELERKVDLLKFTYDRETLNLLGVIGLELDAIVDIAGKLEPLIDDFDLNQCMLLAYRFRPEMQMTQNQESMDGLMVNLLSMQRYPTISVGAGQEWLGDKIIGDDSSWYVSLNVNLPIFDGMGSFSRIKQGKINMRKTTLERSKIEEEIKLQVNKFLIEYNFWKNQYFKAGLAEKNANKESYSETELDIIYNLNNSYYALELSVGVELNSY